MWSAWLWVKRIESTRRTPWASAWARRSVDVSTRTLRTASAIGEPSLPSPISIRIDGRVRRSRGSFERQTSQSQPIIGTPCDVPVPRSVILRLNNAFLAGRRLNVPHSQLVEDLLQHLTLFRRQVAARLLIEERQNLDHLRRTDEIRLGPRAGRIRQIAEMNGRRTGQRQHERGKRESWLLIRHCNHSIVRRGLHVDFSA